MNYIELINQFWRIRRCKPMTAYEADLYYYLMQECNNRNWLNPFNLSTNLICAELGIARKTLSDLRNRLKQKGLIDFIEGQKNKSNAVYELIYVTDGNIQGNVLGNIQGNIDGNILGNHLNTKQKQNNIPPIIPQQGETVATAPDVSEKTRNKGKTDSPLSKIEEEFERFRKAYPGNKRGHKTEFDNFKKKHSDYQTAVCLLYPALMKLNEWRSQKRQLGQFVPEYANLQTWINKRRWEEEFEKIEESNETTQKQTKRYDDGDFSSLLPQCKEAENAVIGALLIESTAIHEVYEVLSKECFYDEAAGEIYDAVRTIWENVGKPDLICVAEELKKRGTLDMVGGPFNLAVLSGRVASTSHIRDHAAYIHQCYLQRQLMMIGGAIMKQATETGIDIDDAITESLSMLENLAANMEYGKGAKAISEAAREALQDYEERERQRNKGKCVGITTGLRILDKHLNGFQNKELIIIGARPAVGKTALALHMAKHAALSGVPVVFFALEMEAAKMADRLIMSMGNVPSVPYRGGWLSETEKAAMFNSVGVVEQLPIYIDDSTNLNIKQIKARCINLQRKGRCGIVFIDYLGLLNMESGNRSYNREQEVSQCSRAAKVMAKELDVPVVLLCQLNRQIESRVNQKGGEYTVPGLADLRESGSIEQDANVVLMLHRPEYYNSSAEKGIGIINIAKQREGKTGKVRFGYNESLTSLYDLEENQTPGEAPF